jgi:hypothetical protein
MPSRMYGAENLSRVDGLEFSIKNNGVKKIVAADTFRSSMAK